ncbi:hypothetical protein ACLK14_06355 [Escherichia coli]
MPAYLRLRDLVGERDNVVFSCGVHPLDQNDIYGVKRHAVWRQKRVL